MYLAWFDANPKKPTTQKIAEAHERYVEKFGRQPLICLVNPDDIVTDSPVELRPLQHISRHCFWIGVDEVAEPAPEIPAAVRAPRAKKAPVEPIVIPAEEVASQTPAVAPRVRKPKAVPAVLAAASADPVTPDAPTMSPRSRKPKVAPSIPVAEPIVAAPEATATPKRVRKPKAEPIAPPTPVVIPEPTTVPTPKRRTRREKVAA